LRSLLSGVAESLSKPTITELDVEQAVQSAQSSDEPAGAVAISLSSVASTSALDALIRASLGTLLNEHGEVSVSRLLQAVTHAIPDLGLSSIVSSLEGLRRDGKVSWPGDDLRKAEVIKVHP
jgi:predicted component of type VI protein secretion system